MRGVLTMELDTAAATPVGSDGLGGVAAGGGGPARFDLTRDDGAGPMVQQSFGGAGTGGIATALGQNSFLDGGSGVGGASA